MWWQIAWLMLPGLKPAYVRSNSIPLDQGDSFSYRCYMYFGTMLQAVAERVAAERGEEVGDSVVRFQT
jgi:hypothetical protein